jgi:hypothetical protein
MKWSDRTAQGFSPGSTRHRIRPKASPTPLRGCNSGRARVLARRERLSGPRDVFPSGDSNSVVGFGPDGSRGRDPSRTFHGVAPHEWRPRCVFRLLACYSSGAARHRVPLVRHIVLVLVVVLVLERVCWQVFAPELYLCAFTELHPRSGLKMLSGHLLLTT